MPHIPYHHDSGPMPKEAVRAIILHDTEGHEAYDEVVFSGADGGAISIHNYINRAGELHDSVPWNRGANHAGYGRIPGCTLNPNDCTIGIELEHHDQPDYPEAQLNTLDKLIADIDAYLGRKVPIYGHKDIDPNRKSDPNPPFPLDVYKKNRSHKPIESLYEDFYWLLASCSSIGQAGGVAAYAQEMGLVNKTIPNGNMELIHVRHTNRPDKRNSYDTVLDWLKGREIPEVYRLPAGSPTVERVV